MKIVILRNIKHRDTDFAEGEECEMDPGIAIELMNMVPPAACLLVVKSAGGAPLNKMLGHPVNKSGGFIQ